MDAARTVEPGFFPLDEELALGPGWFSPTLQQALVLLGAAVPFRQVVPALALLGRVTISGSTVRRLTEQAGAALVAVEDAAVTAIERTLPRTPVGAARQQVSVDGVMVPLRGGEWREAKTMVVGALSHTHPGKAEALSYVSRIQDLEQFTRLATGELHRRGSYAAALVVGVVDGAPWCQSFFDHHLPRAIRVLDFPHAVEHLSRASQACFGLGSAQASDWLGVQAHTLRHGDPQKVIDAVAALPVETAPDPVLAGSVRNKVQTYLQTRLPQLAYAAFAAQDLPIGSGIVESANKLVVEGRLKGAGMHWAAQNADSMLALRCALGGQRWDDAWQQLSHQRRAAARRSRPRPPAPPPLPSPALASTDTQRFLTAPPPRVRTMVNGKPTKDHPWRKPFLFPNTPASAPITKN